MSPDNDLNQGSSSDISASHKRNFYSSDIDEDGHVMMYYLLRTRHYALEYLFLFDLWMFGLKDVQVFKHHSIKEFRADLDEKAPFIKPFSQKQWLQHFKQGIAISKSLNLSIPPEIDQLLKHFNIPLNIDPNKLFKCFSCNDVFLSKKQHQTILSISHNSLSNSVSIVERPYMICKDCSTRISPDTLQSLTFNPYILIRNWKLPRLSDKKFTELMIEIISRDEEDITNGLSFDEFLEQKNKEYGELIAEFYDYLTKNKIKTKAIREDYCWLCHTFLMMAVERYRLPLELLHEQAISEILFDTFLRKISAPQKTRERLLDALLHFADFLLTKNILDVDILDFIKSLEKDKKLFDEQVRSNEGGEFFWETDPNWIANYIEWATSKNLLTFAHRINNEPPEEYVGPLENALEYIFAREFNQKRRELIKQGITDKNKQRSALLLFQKEWMKTPREMFNGYSFIDLILLERREREKMASRR